MQEFSTQDSKKTEEKLKKNSIPFKKHTLITSGGNEDIIVLQDISMCLLTSCIETHN